MGRHRFSLSGLATPGPLRLGCSTGHGPPPSRPQPWAPPAFPRSRGPNVAPGASSPLSSFFIPFLLKAFYCAEFFKIVVASHGGPQPSLSVLNPGRVEAEGGKIILKQALKVLGPVIHSFPFFTLLLPLFLIPPFPLLLPIRPRLDAKLFLVPTLSSR